jgi:hypothetical protein
MSKHEDDLTKARAYVDGLGDDERWALHQALAGAGRFYGDGGTIHSTGTVDVEVGKDGRVVAVWYRCLNLPFMVSDTGAQRVVNPKSRITGVQYVPER